MTARRSRPAGQRVQVARAAWGAALLVAPGAVLRLVGQHEPGTGTRAVVRVLGARHLLQAAFSGRAPGRAVLADGAWVDGVHCLSLLALAAGDRTRARSALVDAVIALAWGVTTARAARRVPLVDDGTAPRRERLALALHPLLPAAPSLGGRSS